MKKEILIIFLSTLLFFTTTLFGEDMKKEIYDFKVKKINGQEIGLDTYRGSVILIVNTASKCGFTPQFEGLEKLYQTYKDRSFVILGFPTNQFANQDPGSNEEIASFCQINYGVSFPMMEKIDVNGVDAHPLYKYLKRESKGILGSELIKWNFTKFLVDKEGRVVKRYSSNTKPEELKGDIEALF